jgi:archaellum component FlaC
MITAATVDRSAYLNSRQTSITNLSLGARYLRQFNFTSETYRSTVDWERVHRPASLQQVFAQYDAKVRVQQAQALHYSVTGYIFDAAFLLAPAAVPKNAGVVEGTLRRTAQTFGKKQAQESLHGALKELMNHGSQQTSAFLETKLKELAKNDLLLPSLKHFTAAQRLEWLTNNNVVDQLLAADVRPEDRDIVQGMAVFALDGIVKNGFSNQAAVTDAIRTEMAKQVQAVAGTLAGFQKETANALDEIASDQKQIANDLAETRDDVDFVKEYLFDRMTATEQLEALKARRAPAMTEQEQAAFIKKTTLVARREALVNKINDYSNGAAQVAKLAQNLGVDPNIVNVLNKGAEIGNAATAIIAGIAGGPLGYVSAANAVFGLMSGGGDDGSAARHTQIMNMLNKIAGGIEAIQDKLEVMARQLNVIQELQEQTLTAVMDLAARTEKIRLETFEKLFEVRLDLFDIKAALNDLALGDIEQIPEFFDRLRRRGYADIGDADFEALRAAYSDQYSLPHSAVSKLQSEFSASNKRTTYQLQHVSKPGGATASFIEKTFGPTFQYVSEGDNYRYGRGLIAAFSFPVTAISYAQVKLNRLLAAPDDVLKSSFDGISNDDWPEFLQRLAAPLNIKLLGHHIAYLLQVFPLMDMEKALLNNAPEQILQDAADPPDSLYALKGALLLCEIAIVQYAMLGSDLLLPLMVQEWQSFSEQRRDGETDHAFAARLHRREGFQRMVNGNAILRRNLVSGAVHLSLKRSKNWANYAFAYESAAANFIQSALPEIAGLTWNPATSASQGWHLQIGDTFERLPSPEEALRGEITHHPALEQVLLLKQRLIDEIASFDLLTESSEAAQTAVKEMIWSAANLRQGE